MKRQIIILYFFCIVQLINAQNFTHEFGKYSNVEFDMNSYSKYSSSEAVVIYDIGKSFFGLSDNGFELYFERKTKIKILTKAGLKWGEISIPYYEENLKGEEIYELKGNTYNYENGEIRVSTLNPNNSYNEKFNEHWYNKKFAMPDVKEGSIIEVTYKVKSPYLFNLRSWDFQNEIPVIYSEYTTSMIPFYEYTYLLQGSSKFDEYKSYVDKGIDNQYSGIKYQDMVYFFVMKDIPAFKDESFITSANDYIIKLDFQLAAIHYTNGSNIAIMTTWPKMSEEMIDNEYFGKYLKVSKKKSKDIIDTMHIALKPSIEKAKIIEHFVKTNFNWNDYNSKYTSKSVKEFLTSKTGNSADVNLFLTGMLNTAGIEAYPVILSTRNHGKIKFDYPFDHFFNYVIVLAKIDSTSILLDATDPLCQFNEIPSKCLNDNGFIIQKNKVEWVNLKSNSVSKNEKYFNIQTNLANDSIYQTSKLITTGYEAIDFRNKFSTSYKDLKVNLLGTNYLLSDTLIPSNLNEIDKPFELGFCRKYSLETIEDKIIISPFCNTTITENPLKQNFRTYPVDMVYRKANIFQSTILIPKGYKLLTKPENLNIRNDLVKIVYAIDVLNNDKINVIGVYEFKKDVYGISDYFDLKNYFNKIVDKFNEKLVFVKI